MNMLYNKILKIPVNTKKIIEVNYLSILTKSLYGKRLMDIFKVFRNAYGTVLMSLYMIP
jgi:hypothetical protein